MGREEKRGERRDEGGGRKEGKKEFWPLTTGVGLLKEVPSTAKLPFVTKAKRSLPDSPSASQSFREATKIALSTECHIIPGAGRGRHLWYPFTER